MGRPPCCEENGVKKGPWTPEEDDKLFNYITKHGSGNWKSVPKHAGLNRCGKSCRLRWTNYLSPDIKRGKFTEEEERLIINVHSVLGNKWSKIATHLPGRTDNEIKNYWNTNLRKKLLQMGIDPETHKPRTDFKHLLNLSQLLGLASNNSSNSNLMNPSWIQSAGLLGLQQPAELTQQLVQLQLLQNLLQLINGNSSMLMVNHSLTNNNPVQEHTNGLNSESSGHDVSESSWTNHHHLEGASSDHEVSGRTTSHDIMISEGQQNIVPKLESSTIFFNNQNEVKEEVVLSTQPKDTTDHWENLLEDYDDSFWKELFDFTSTSESPASW